MSAGLHRPAAVAGLAQPGGEHARVRQRRTQLRHVRRPQRGPRPSASCSSPACADLRRPSPEDLTPVRPSAVTARSVSWPVSERWPPDRPVGQDPPARGRPRAGGRVPQGDRAVRRARAQPRAHPHLPADPAGTVERARRRPRRRAGRQRAAHLQPLRRPARPAGRRRRDDGPLRPAPARQAPDPRPGAAQHRPGRSSRRCVRSKKVAGMLGERLDDRRRVAVHASERGNLKQALLKLGWPAEDFAGYVDGEAHPIELDEDDWSLRDLPEGGRRRRSGTAAPGSSYSPAAPARPSSAPPRWRTPRRPR